MNKIDFNYKKLDIVTDLKFASEISIKFKLGFVFWFKDVCSFYRFSIINYEMVYFNE